MSVNAFAGNGELTEYFRSVSRLEMMSPKDELEVARQWRLTGDRRCADKLVSANLRFVIKIALEYRNYGFSIVDLVQEGNLGLVRAVQSYDPDRGFRLISYAVWWIRAYIQEYILKHWSLVKIGTTQLQRRLFNHMQSSQKRLRRMMTEEEEQRAREKLAAAVGGTVRDVEEMERRLQGRDVSLDTPLSSQDSESQFSMHERLAAAGPSSDEILVEREQAELMSKAVKNALDLLEERERMIVVSRHLADEQMTLRELGERLGISKERVRQIEDRALKTLKSAIASSTDASQLFAA